jgi:SAM-dependent MidA family methyltransferase
MQEFSKYFEGWLYGEDGYYSKYKDIGKSGDFFTAVSTSSFFGGSIANKIIKVIESDELPKDTTIVEIGAHHGYLLSDIIQFIYTLKPELLETLKFAIVERFGHLQEAQRRYFKECFGDVISLIHYDDISDVKLSSAFMVANEIFDAFSCELIYTKDGVIQKAYVDEEHKINFKDCEDRDILDFCQKYGVQKGEYPLFYKEFAQIMSENIGKFHFCTFDYGDIYTRNDYSARIYSKHKVFPIFEDGLNLGELYQKSDITYDVPFSYLIDCYKDLGCNVEFRTQLQALVDFGIIDLLEILQKNTTQEHYLKELNKVKLLLEPTGMGDRFKMIYVKSSLK